jgi:hypothetical protein
VPDVNAYASFAVDVGYVFDVEAIWWYTAVPYRRHLFYFTLADTRLRANQIHALIIHTDIAYPSHEMLYTLITLGSVQSLLYLNVIAKHLEAQYHRRVSAQDNAMPSKIAWLHKPAWLMISILQCSSHGVTLHSQHGSIKRGHVVMPKRNMIQLNLKHALLDKHQQHSLQHYCCCWH